MVGIISNIGHKPIIVNGMGDHVHLLVGLRPDKCLSDLVKEVKRSSTNFINRQKLIKGKFSWQEGYGAFAHSNSNNYCSTLFGLQFKYTFSVYQC
jgi:REP element-mobilizing transposase RayT